VETLIASLELAPHSEGGYYRQTFRSASVVRPDDGRPARSALTTIYFLLTEGAVSCWHRVASDEVWHFYEGAPLALVTAGAGWASVTRHTLGPLGETMAPVHVVRAGDWQAARSTGPYTLVGCTVGPGFEFEDFEMMRDGGSDARLVRERWPDLGAFVRRDDA
jgi:predicted cupin superfamily sugar epimerase